MRYVNGDCKQAVANESGLQRRSKSDGDWGAISVQIVSEILRLYGTTERASERAEVDKSGRIHFIITARSMVQCVPRVLG